jgi:hypothetical protein
MRDAQKNVGRHPSQVYFKTMSGVAGADQTILDMHSIWTLYGAGSTIAATYIADFSCKIPEAYDRMMVVAVEIMIGQEAQHIRHRQALRAHSFALAAHTAVIRPDLSRLMRPARLRVERDRLAEIFFVTERSP